MYEERKTLYAMEAAIVNMHACYAAQLAPACILGKIDSYLLGFGLKGLHIFAKLCGYYDSSYVHKRTTVYIC